MIAALEVRPASARAAPFGGEEGVTKTLEYFVAKLSATDAPAPRWINLDGVVFGAQGIRTLADALNGQKPEPTVDTLSLRYCRLDAEATTALIDLVHSNPSLETLYLHMAPLDEAAKARLFEAWKAHGTLHRATNAGLNLFRKVQTAYLADRLSHFPEWARASLPAKKAAKKPAKKGKKGKK